MRTRLIILGLMVALALSPVLPYVANVAFGYGGGGAGTLPPVVPPVTVTPPPVVVPPVTTVTPTLTTLEQLRSEAIDMLSGLIAQQDLTSEKLYKARIVDKIISGNTSADVVKAITNFVTYGTLSTARLGAGERGGVVNSFKAAFGKLPVTNDDWNDVVKIGNGRWPSQTNKQAEDKAKVSFKKVYGRDAVMTNSNDNAAVTVMAYGLRPVNRNLNSERAAIKTFKATYFKTPVSANDWDTVRAVANSGAKR